MPGVPGQDLTDSIRGYARCGQLSPKRACEAIDKAGGYISDDAPPELSHLAGDLQVGRHRHHCSLIDFPNGR